VSAPAAAAAPPRAWAQLVGYYASLGAVGLASAALGPTLPGLAEQTGVSLGGISLVFVARSVGYLAGSLLVGRLYDRLPGHPIMAAGLGLMAASLGLMPFAPWLWALAGLMAVLGAAEAAVDVGNNTLIVWTYGDAVGPYMNGLHFSFGAGAFLAPLVVAQVLGQGGTIAWAYWALAALTLPPALWLARLPSPGGRAPAAQAAPTAAAGGVSRYGLVALLTACFFFYVGAEMGFGAWVYTYAERMGLADAASAAYLTSAFWGALTAGRLLSIPLAARLRPRTLLAAALSGCLASVGAAWLWPGSPALLWAAALGTGFSMATIFPTLMAFASRRLALTGQITSFFFIGGSLGGMFLPWLIGQWVEPAGPRVVLAVIFSGLALDLAAFLALVAFTPRPAPPSA